MPRARSINHEPRQTAAASENGSGCFSVYWMPPLAALFHRLPAGSLCAECTDPDIRTADQYIRTRQQLQLRFPHRAGGSWPRVRIILFELRSSSSVVDNEWDLPIFTREIQYWGKDIVRWANAASLDPNLLAVVMQIESCGDPRAVSSAGASGLFQVMPFHFHYRRKSVRPGYQCAARHELSFPLAGSWRGKPRLALAGYNGGIGVISRSESSWASETHRYVRFGAPIYEDARSGATIQPHSR
jgi:hypothetical protein